MKTLLKIILLLIGIMISFNFMFKYIELGNTTMAFVCGMFHITSILLLLYVIMKQFNPIFRAFIVIALQLIGIFISMQAIAEHRAIVVISILLMIVYTYNIIRCLKDMFRMLFDYKE